MCSDHNHDFNPSYSILVSAHRSISIQMKMQLEANDRVDCRNFIEERRRLRLGEGDVEAVRNLFIRLKAKDPNFYHLMDMDDEGMFSNVLWIHPRSITAYEEFHDILSFDITYLMNSVNHHGHSILLGCALVTHEDVASFKWIFSNWLEAMVGVHPTSIITNQCESIKNALKDIMPYSIYRYYIWHIMAKLPVKFRCVPDYNKVIDEWK
ncbi:hypothetical protein C2S51_024721 [Perilla frutescens var. frutescens]|nr:hypothetical protein C2S51_024721 [Perilla frutescens var. frutescens]